MVYSDGGWFSARVTVAKDHQSNAFTAYLGSLLSREQFEINTMEPKSIDIHKQIPVTEFAVLYKRFGGI